MTPRKTPAPKGLISKLKWFWAAMGDRYQHALQVIDEALASDNMKEKIWAVDWILKRSPAAEPESKTASSSTEKKSTKLPSPTELDGLSEAELMARIRDYLKDWEPE